MTLTDQIYAEVTDKILKELEKGTAPWRKTWSGGAPKNLVSGKNYRGINAFLLAIQGDEYFLTYKQCQELGGKVKAGSKGSRVIYWNIVARETDAGELKTIPFLKYYTVFGASQCEGLTLPERFAKVSDEEKIEAAETIIKGYFGPSVAIALFIDRLRIPFRCLKKPLLTLSETFTRFFFTSWDTLLGTNED